MLLLKAQQRLALPAARQPVATVPSALLSRCRPARRSSRAATRAAAEEAAVQTQPQQEQQQGGAGNPPAEAPEQPFISLNGRTNVDRLVQSVLDVSNAAAAAAGSVTEPTEVLMLRCKGMQQVSAGLQALAAAQGVLAEGRPEGPKLQVRFNLNRPRDVPFKVALSEGCSATLHVLLVPGKLAEVPEKVVKAASRTEFRALAKVVMLDMRARQECVISAVGEAAVGCAFKAMALARIDMMFPRHPSAREEEGAAAAQEPLPPPANFICEPSMVMQKAGYVSTVPVVNLLLLPTAVPQLQQALERPAAERRPPGGKRSSSRSRSSSRRSSSGSDAAAEASAAELAAMKEQVALLMQQHQELTALLTAKLTEKAEQ